MTNKIILIERIKRIMAKEEWQDPDSGYLNCIGVGDTYVKKQIARILSQNKFTADYISWFTHKNGIDVNTGNVEFKEKKR